MFKSKIFASLSILFSIVIFNFGAGRTFAATINTTALTSGGTLFDFEGFPDLTNADNLFAAQGLTFSDDDPVYSSNTKIRHAPRGDWTPLSGIAVLENPNVSPTNMSMYFSTPKSAVEFYFSDDAPLNDYDFTAYDASNNVLESASLSFATDRNASGDFAVFITFLRPSADISRIAIVSHAFAYVGQTDFYGIDDLRLDGSTSVVPLAATLPLFASGLGAISALVWRRKRKKAAALAA